MAYSVNLARCACTYACTMAQWRTYPHQCMTCNGNWRSVHVDAMLGTLSSLINVMHAQEVNFVLHACWIGACACNDCPVTMLHRAVLGTVLIFRDRPKCYDQGFTLWHSQGVVDVIVWTTWGVLISMGAVVFITYTLLPQYNSKASW